MPMSPGAMRRILSEQAAIGRRYAALKIEEKK